jgi:Methyltransferase FkbM domain
VPVFFARADTNISPDRGLGHVDQRVAETAPATIRIDAISLDEYMAKASPPDFRKCDVEGAEVEVFRGVRKLLSEKKPVILCEMHSEENRRVLLAEFERFGYHCESCGDNPVLAQRSSLASELFTRSDESHSPFLRQHRHDFR